MIVKIVCFSALKEYFEPRFAVNIPDDSTFSDLSDHLKQINEKSINQLNSSSFWVDDVFQKLSNKIVPNTEVCILPYA